MTPSLIAIIVLLILSLLIALGLKEPKMILGDGSE